ncbi:MAG: hypothetical protein HYX56_03315 [Chloroflexi bacterium]|nr:hypothetical protein [Chloroflexota bacterium]
MKERLRAKAKERGVSMSQVVRDGLKIVLAPPPKARRRSA